MGLAVSIVTPSYQMSRFLKETIDCVLAQTYRPIEYLILDAGSTDGTLDLLKSYGDRISWVSRPDQGAQFAIRDGLAAAKGEILAWLNADDLLMPDAVEQAVRALEAAPSLAAVYGDGLWVDEHAQPLRRYPTREFRQELLAEECIICQPACFFRATAYRQAGGIDTAWNSAFDYDLWIRLARFGPFEYVPSLWAKSRMHRDNKTLSRRGEVFREGMAVIEKHFGYVPFSWIYSEQVWLRDGRDQFFEPLSPSIPAWLKSLPLGLKRNSRSPLRYTLEWLGAPDWRAQIKKVSQQSPSR